MFDVDVDVVADYRHDVATTVDVVAILMPDAASPSR